jgi:xylulokinase
MIDAVLLLGIDIGTTNCKALVFDRSGRPHGSASRPTPAQRPRPGWVEYDPEQLWQAVVEIVRQALSQVEPLRVRGLAVASMAEAGLLLDVAGQPLHPIISWNDSRSDEHYRRWLERFDAMAFFQIAGNPANPLFSVFRLIWLREHAPAVYAAAARWLHVSDYIAFRLCGAQATDYSLATRTMLFDLGQLRWSDALVAAAGLRADLLPKAVPGGTRIGAVSAAAALATGLPTGTAVGAGGHDHICGALAAGASVEGIGLDSMGTAEPAFLPLNTLRLPQATDPNGCSFGAHVASGQYYALKGLRNSGAAVAWAKLVLGFGEAYDRMQAAAAQAPAGSRGVLFLPRLAPIDRGAFIGLTSEAGTADLARAVYEGLAYEWRSNLETIESAIQARAETIRLIGGGVRSDVWVQIKADVLGRPLRVLDMQESVALGAALLGGLAAGVYQDLAEAAAGLRFTERVVVPDRARVAFYDRCYHEVFLRIAPALADIHQAVGTLPAAEDESVPYSKEHHY